MTSNEKKNTHTHNINNTLSSTSNSAKNTSTSIVYGKVFLPSWVDCCELGAVVKLFLLLLRV